MTTLWLLLIAFAGFVAFAAVGDLVSAEVRGRLDALPHAVLRLAARRLPDDLRAERLAEWEGELHEILCGAEALPVTRLWRGLRYAVGIVRAAPSIARALSVEDRTKSRRGSARKWVLSGIQFTRDAMVVILASFFAIIFDPLALEPALHSKLSIEGWGIIFSGSIALFFVTLLIFIFAARKTVARVAALVASCAVLVAFLDVAVAGFINLGLSTGWLTYMATLIGFTFAGGLSVAWTAHLIRTAVSARRLRVNSAAEPGVGQSR
jgi:hypothetical protein